MAIQLSFRVFFVDGSEIQKKNSWWVVQIPIIYDGVLYECQVVPSTGRNSELDSVVYHLLTPPPGSKALRVFHNQPEPGDVMSHGETYTPTGYEQMIT